MALVDVTISKIITTRGGGLKRQIITMYKDVSEKKEELPENDREETDKKKKEWKDIINLPDDLDSEIH